MTRRFTYLIAATAAIGAVARVWGLGRQALTLDELLMLPTANHYVRFGVPRPELPFHPNLRNILLYLSGQMFGTSAAGLKGWSVLFGVLSVVLLGLLVWRLTRSETASVVAATLLAIDPLSIYMSRSGLQDGWTTFFALAGLHFALSVIESERGAFATWGPLLCGAVFGLGVATKFYVIPIEATAIIYVAVVLWRQGRRPLAVWASAAVLLSSLLAFTLTYLPWFAAGHSVPEWFAYLRALNEAISSHSISLIDNTDTRAWQWFVKPFVAWQEMEYAYPLPGMGIALANPVTWLATIPAAVVVVLRQRAQRGAMILLGLLAVSYVPLLVVSRPIWVLSAVSVVPFAFAITAVALKEVARRIGGMKVVMTYVAAAALLSAALFPGVTGDALDVGYLRVAVRRAAGTGSLLPPIEEQLNR